MLSFFLVKPFITAILSAFVFAYLFYPLYNLLNKKIKRKNLSATITLIIMILILIIPSAFITSTLVKESYVAYLFTKQKIGANLNLECEKGAFCEWMHKFEADVLGKDIKTYLKENIEKFTSIMVNKISSFVVGIAGKILNIFIFLFLTFFLLKDGRKMSKSLGNLLLLKSGAKKKILNEISDLIYAVVFGTIILALVQGAFATGGYYLFGINSPLMWGIMTAFAALLPFIGTALIWLPLGLALIVNGVITPETALIGKGIGLILYGALIVGSIDNLLRPKIVGDRSVLHPALVLLGVAGGVFMFGFIGIIIGPVILALLVIALRMLDDSLLKHPLSDFKIKPKK